MFTIVKIIILLEVQVDTFKQYEVFSFCCNGNFVLWDRVDQINGKYIVHIITYHVIVTVGKYICNINTIFTICSHKELIRHDSSLTTLTNGRKLYMPYWINVNLWLKIIYCKVLLDYYRNNALRIWTIYQNS